MTVKTLGRCPDCGKPAPTIAIPGRATQILEQLGYAEKKEATA